MTRREVGVWLLLLGRLQEAPPTKVCNDCGDDDEDGDAYVADGAAAATKVDDPQAAGERAEQQGLTLSGTSVLFASSSSASTASPQPPASSSPTSPPSSY